MEVMKIKAVNHAGAVVRAAVEWVAYSTDVAVSLGVELRGSV